MGLCAFSVMRSRWATLVRRNRYSRVRIFCCQRSTRLHRGRNVVLERNYRRRQHYLSFRAFCRRANLFLAYFALAFLAHQKKALRGSISRSWHQIDISSALFPRISHDRLLCGGQYALFLYKIIIPCCWEKIRKTTNRHFQGFIK